MVEGWEETPDEWSSSRGTRRVSTPSSELCCSRCCLGCSGDLPSLRLRARRVPEPRLQPSAGHALGSGPRLSLFALLLMLLAELLLTLMAELFTQLAELLLTLLAALLLTLLAALLLTLLAVLLLALLAALLPTLLCALLAPVPAVFVSAALAPVPMLPRFCTTSFLLEISWDVCCC